jgi:guanylate kinase
MARKLVILSAPSGAGKSTIISQLIKKDFNLEFSISACTRKPRGEEKHGVEYYFFYINDFKQKIENNEFIEWEEVYKNNFYGTLKTEIDRIFAKGNNVIFDIDIAGGLNIKKQYGNNAISIFIMPPSIEELENRLKTRGTDSLDDIKNRVEKAKFEISFSNKFDIVVVNENVETAVNEISNILTNFLI